MHTNIPAAVPKCHRQSCRCFLSVHPITVQQHRQQAVGWAAAGQGGHPQALDVQV